jgi:hypothetical protein
MFAPRLLLASVSVALGGCSTTWPLTECHTALEWPIVFNAGVYESPEFETKFLQYRYHISLRAFRRLPNRQLYCYMGLGDSGNCNDSPVQVNVKWEVVDGSRVVASGTQNGAASVGGYTQDYVLRSFAGFASDEGRKYRMRIAILESGASLNPATPILHIGACHNPIDKSVQ